MEFSFPRSRCSILGSIEYGQVHASHVLVFFFEDGIPVVPVSNVSAQVDFLRLLKEVSYRSAQCILDHLCGTTIHEQAHAVAHNPNSTQNPQAKLLHPSKPQYHTRRIPPAPPSLSSKESMLKHLSSLHPLPTLKPHQRCH